MPNSMSYAEFYPKLIKVLQNFTPPQNTPPPLQHMWQERLQSFDNTIQQFLNTHAKARSYYDREVEHGLWQGSFQAWVAQNYPSFPAILNMMRQEEGAVNSIGEQAFEQRFSQLIQENGVGREELYVDEEKQY